MHLHRRPPRGALPATAAGPTTGVRVGLGTAPATTSLGALLALVPLAVAVAMSGCFLFLQRMTSRRRHGHPAAVCAHGCGLSHPLQPLQSAKLCSCACGAGGSADGPCHLHSVDIICSPASSSDGGSSRGGGFSSCSSSGASSYHRCSSSGSLAGYATSYGSSGFCSDGALSPVGHVGSACGSPGPDVRAACEIVLLERECGDEYCLFVHKRLRPIKTRADGEWARCAATTCGARGSRNPGTTAHFQPLPFPCACSIREAGPPEGTNNQQLHLQPEPVPGPAGSRHAWRREQHRWQQQPDVLHRRVERRLDSIAFSTLNFDRPPWPRCIAASISRCPDALVSTPILRCLTFVDCHNASRCCVLRGCP